MITNNKNISTALAVLKKTFSHLDLVRKKQLKRVLALTIFASLAESMSIAMLVPFISFFVNPELYLFNNFFKTIFNFLNVNGKEEILFIISLFFILIVLVSGYIKLKYIKLSNRAADNVTSDFRIKIFNFFINQDFSYNSKYGSNEIMSNLTQKTSFFTSIIFAAISILHAILTTTAIVIVLIFNEPFFTPILILIIGLFFFIVFKFKLRTVLNEGEKINTKTNYVVNIFENTVGHLPEIIIYNLKTFYSAVLTKISKELALSGSNIRTISMSPRIFLEIFVIVTAVIFIYFSAFSERTIVMNLSYLAILAFGAQKCLPLINSIYLMSVSIKGVTPTILTFLNILENGRKDLIDNKHYKTLDFNETLKLKNLSYQYNTTLPKILNNITIEVKKGEKVAIKGETGSGKSTLINIISGLLDQTEGKMLVDNTEVKTENKKNWQKNISIVPQAIFLHDASILENIAIGINVNEIDFDIVKKSAKLAHIDSFIEKLPNKYNEKVGERGVRLSGGQKQRIGIARAFYRNSSLIILDEPTNALDLATENLIMESIKIIGKNITVIMISHSNNSLKYFDKIIDLDKLK